MSNESAIAKTSDKMVRNLKGRAVVAPLVDIFENPNEFLLVADLPGVADDKVSVHLDRGEMLIEATRVEQPSGTALGREFPILDYRRTFVLPDTVNGDGITAELKKGVLSVHIPKAASARPRKIEVKAG